MIYIKPEYRQLFTNFKTMDDFLSIDINIVRDFKNRKTGRFEVNGQGFYIKKHFPCGIGAVIDEISHLRKPHIGAGYERISLDKLHELGVDTMNVVAFGQDGSTLASQRSFLVTEELTNVESLEDVCKDWTQNPASPVFKHALIKQVAGIAKNIHKNGMNHRDFYICHFFLDTASEQQSPRLFLIDLHRAQIRSSVPFRWLVKDIAGLYFSSFDIGLTKTDIYRFIKLYTGMPLRDALNQKKRFWKAVTSRAIRTYKKDFGKHPTLVIGN